LDLRLPIGGLFTIFGAILAVFGLVANKAIYSASLGINVNLDWGVVLLVFGGLMLAFALKAKPEDDDEKKELGSGTDKPF
jgi:hypothetical protein